VFVAQCTGHDYSKPGKPQADHDDPAAKDTLVSALVNDANTVLAAFAGAGRGETAASALALLALVAGQDVEPAEGSDGRDGRWRIARKVAGDRVVSTVDEQARHTRKSPSARRDGYRAHLAADPETGIITGEKLTMASGGENADAAVAAELVKDEAILRASRAEWPALREDYKKWRLHVERAVAQAATQRGRRLKLRYRGVTPNDAWLKTRTAALNLRNLIGRGLTLHDGTWLLAPGHLTPQPATGRDATPACRAGRPPTPAPRPRTHAAPQQPAAPRASLTAAPRQPRSGPIQQPPRTSRPAV
jgi:hypothetical protein